MNIEQIINGMADKIETLENKYKYMFNNKDIEHLIDKIEMLEQQIPDINQETTETIKLNDKYDALEAKYYSLRSELDGVYKVLEMDALDIKNLQDELKEGK